LNVCTLDEVLASNPHQHRKTYKRKSYWKTTNKVAELLEDGAEIIDIYWYPELHGELGKIAADEEDIA